MAIFGFLVFFLHSHATIQEKIRTKRIRLYITKLPRTHFLWGKFLGTLSFWLILIIGGYFLLSFMQPSLFLPKEGWKTVFVLFSLTTFYAGLIILLSTIFTHPFFLMIVGLSYSLFLLIGSILYLIQPDFLPPQIQLFLPLYWIQLPQVLYLLVPVSSGLIFSLFATTLLNRKDL
jgi:ABC-2 type transport system permease protein